MSKILKLIFLIIVSSCSCFCIGQTFQEQQEQIKKEYSKSLSFFPKEFTDHFLEPNNMVLVYYKIEVPGATNLNQFYAAFYFEGKEIKKIEKKVKRKALEHYKFTDPCLMIIDYDSTSCCLGKNKINQCDNFTGMLPLPNFDFLRESDLTPDFYDNANIYVLGSEKGKFLEDKLLWSKGVGLPEEWKNGYSKGLLFSGNWVVCWLNVW